MGDAPGTNTVRGALLSAISERQTLALAFASLVLGVVAHLVSRDDLIPLWAFWYLAILSVATLWIVLAALKKALQEKVSLPAVRAVVSDPPDHDRPILLLEPSILFGISTLVAIYHRDSGTGYEILVGHGVVRTVQTDRQIQVKVEEWSSGNDELVSRILNQNTATIDALIVRAGSMRVPALAHDLFSARLFEMLIKPSTADLKIASLEKDDG
jgi:hypothetical protein